MACIAQSILSSSPSPLAVVEGKVRVAGEGSTHWHQLTAAVDLPEGKYTVMVWPNESEGPALDDLLGIAKDFRPGVPSEQIVAEARGQEWVDDESEAEDG